MAVTCIKITWGYKPADLFEQVDSFESAHGTVTLDAGRAVLSLRNLQQEQTEQLRMSARAEIHARLLARGIVAQQAVILDEEPNIETIHDSGRKDMLVFLRGTVAVTFTGRANVVTMDAGGNVIGDTARERRERDAAFLAGIAPKIPRDADLRFIVEAFNNAMADPANELTRLYEVRDRMKKRYGTVEKAARALNAEAAFLTLRTLANDEPIQQGRHRGIHAGALRSASHAELEAARAAARTIIEAFAATVK